MNELNKKRRTSILKKRQSTEDDQTEITVSKLPKKAQFSQKKQVKEFTQCEENLTIWGNTYETSVAKSEGSSDGSSTSRKISVDFSHTTINVTTHEAASMNESEKENLMVEKSLPRISDEQRSSLNNLSSASNSGCSIELTTVDMNASERKRVNNYGTDNLNITNMPLDNSYITNKHLNVPGKKPDKVLSPRKMVFYHKNSNLSVIIKDKVLLSPSEMDDNVSVSIEDDEQEQNIKPSAAYRKTITKPVDMNISVEHKTSGVKKIGISDEKKQPSISKQAQAAKLFPSTFKTAAVEKPQSMSIVPKAFKVPEIPKTFNFQQQCYDSPPIKPANLYNQKEEIDELFEMMVSDTPSKNLCCIGKTHTPVRSNQKVLFSTSRPTSLRKSTDIFREIGLIDDDEDNKVKTLRRTIFHNDSMKLDANHKSDGRKTTFDKVKMDETLETNNKTQNDGDLDISIESIKKAVPPKEEELFTDKMEETCTEKRNDKSTAQKSFFDLDDDNVASCSVSRNIPLMRFKPAEFDSVEKSSKRSISSNDTCNATNFIMELTNIDDTGGSLETTAEIQRKAAKLLKNPHATLGSSSTINSPFPEDISETMFKEPSKVHKSLNLEPNMTFENLQKSSTSYKNRMTTFDENKMEISGIEPTIEDPNDLPMLKKSYLEMSQKNVSKIQVDPVYQSVKNRTTTYNVDQMEISRVENPEHTNTANLKIPKSYEIHVSPKEMAKLKGKQSAVPTNIEEPKKRVTTYNTDNMDLSGCELTSNGPQHEVLRDSVIKSVKSTSKIQIYTDESMTMQEETQNKRATTYNNNDLNVSVAATDKKRGTCYNLNNMDVSRVEASAEFGNGHFLSNLNSSIPEDLTDIVPRDAKIHKSMFLESMKTIDSQVIKNRATTYNIDQMDVTNIETTSQLPIKKQSNSRATTYNVGQMDITTVDTTSNVQLKKQVNSRATTYLLKDMTETCTNANKMQSQDSKPVKSRATTYNVDEMDMTTVGATSQHQRNLDHTITHNLRTTMPYEIHVSPKEMAMINRSLQKSTEEPKKRVTTYKADDMDVTGYEGADLQAQKTSELIVQNSKSQIQVYNDENMSMELKDDLTDNMRVTVANTNRATTYNPNDMNVSVAPTDKKRTTSYNMDISGIEATDEFLKRFLVKETVNEEKSIKNTADMTLEDPKSAKNRATTYNVNQMDISRTNTSFDMPEHTNTANLRVQKQYEIHVSPKEMAKAKKADCSVANSSKYLDVPKSRATTYNVGQMDISGTELEDDANSTLVPKIQINDNEQNMSLEVRESPLHKKRATTYNRNNMDVSALMVDNKRTTSYLVNNMDVSGTPGSSGFCEQSPTIVPEVEEPRDRRKTFTVTKKRESLKWHNITDTDLLNMIDDESNPCVQDISGSLPVSSEASNMSRYDEAMEDFMNLTVKASPLNQSVPFEVKMRQRRESRTISAIPDYNSMFDNLVEDLKQKDRPKPRLEIDEYLEKLKIEPVKIPRYPQNQEGYLLNKIKEMRQEQKDKAEERRRLKKEIEAAQFPQIPTQKFLMKNYIECLENEIQKEVELRQPVIAPVFPEDIDFEKLLNNKFRTDEHLSQYWLLDSLFWYKGRFKLTHKKMNMFTLNFICQQYLTEADESTIPIIFKDVMLYLDPDFRKPWTTTMKNGLTRREFHRAIHGVDNFTSICNSSSQLLTFMDYYHTNAMKAIETVDNFFNIVNKYKAVYKVHPVYKYNMVRKRCFLSDDTVDIEISVEGYLEDISIKNLSIDGNDYTYTLEPHTNLSEMKGLMLVELVLFDTEKFLQINTSRVKIEED